MKNIACLFTILVSVLFNNCKCQKYTPRTGFIYSPGISWTENNKQDSVIDIIVEGDTMTSVRNLLEYCLQEKRENDWARLILLSINLDAMKKLFKSDNFNHYLSEYRKSVIINSKQRKDKFKRD